MQGHWAVTPLHGRLYVGKRVLAPHEMDWHPYPDVGDRQHGARENRGLGYIALCHEFAEAHARRLLGHAMQLAAAEVVAQGREETRLYYDLQYEPWSLARGLPQRSIAL